MRKKGFTIIETIVTVALLGVIFLLMAPLIRGLGSVNNRVKTQKEIDREFANINEFIQKKIRSAKNTSSSGSYAEVFNSLTDYPLSPLTSEDGSVLYLEVPSADSAASEDILFIFDETDTDNKKLLYSNDGGSNTETLMEGLSIATFRYQEGIILYYIDLDIGEFEGRLRSSFKGSASTRIDIN